MIVSMTDEAQIPKRKRWRWIIAGVLLFLAVAVWRLYPRTDSRFVGKWRLTDQPELEMHLLPNGTQAIVLDGEIASANTRWWVDGSRFHYHTMKRDWLSEVMGLAEYHQARWKGARLPDGYWDDAIIRIDESILELKNVDREPYVWARIPE
jgi:hypothetical protein